MAKTQPVSVRLAEETNLLVVEEARRSGRSRSAVVEELTDEAAKTRLYPGIAFRGRPRRAWVIGTGLDIWELVEMVRDYGDDLSRLLKHHPRVNERAVRIAQAYAERFPDEIGGLIAANSRTPDELRELYPFLEF